MAYNSIYGISNRLRLSGLASGLDVDSVVEQLMRVEQEKVDKVKQSKTLLEWKRDDYRSIINSIRAFKDEFFDVLKPATNMRSAYSLAAYKTTYNGSDTSSYFTATAGAGAIPGSFKISSIVLAKAAKATSASSLTKGMTGIDVDLSTEISASNNNNKFTVTFNGTTKEITLDDGINSIEALVNNLNQKLEEAFGAGKITAGSDGNKITFTTSSTNVLGIDKAYNNGYTKIFGAAINGSITLDHQSNRFTVKLNDGEARSIELEAKKYSNADDLVKEIQQKIDDQFGSGTIRVLNQNNKIVMKSIGSSGTASGTLTGINISGGVTINSESNTLEVTIDGETKSITLDEKEYSKSELLSAIQAKLNSAFGANKAMVSVDESTGQLRFEGISDTNKITIGKEENKGLETIGYKDANKSNKLNLNAKLSDIAGFFGSGPLTFAGDTTDGYYIKFEINGKEFKFNSSQTLNDVLNTVNGNSEAGVKMYYDQLNDKIVVQGKNTGVTSKIQISDSAEGGNLMAVLGLAGTNVTGTDAAMTYDDGSGESKTITRSGNDFTINGIAFSLKKELNSVTDEPIEVSIEGDPTKTIELIKSFVNKYNELLDTINSELSEKRYLDYPPLTEAQKAELSENDIILWEEKAKSGMLKNDSILSGFVTKMRETLYQEVEGVSAKLYSIGITTGTWDQKGKLVINETKLKEAIQNSPDEVIKLFTNESSISYSPDMSAADRAKRNSENGIANRLYDVIQDYIRTTRNSNGQKGILLEKAGIVGDVTENNNSISREIESKEKTISTLLDKLTDKENQYYAKFTAMETYISRMNTQISWLTQQMGGY